MPVKADLREQMDIFGDKHTWVMTSIYLRTFGVFPASPPPPPHPTR